MPRNQSKSQLRNLSQYRGLSEDDFEALWEEKKDRLSTSESFQNRIEKKILEFSEDYDIEDLKINDRESLYALVRAIITLEDYEHFLYNIRAQETVTAANINLVDRVSKISSDLRKDISGLQEDLNIKRKIRKTDKESSVISYIGDLKEKARRFYESRALYVFCPKCNMLIGTVWTLYPEENNTFQFVCKRKLDDGSFCNEHTTVTSKELVDKKGTNKPEITPEGML